MCVVSGGVEVEWSKRAGMDVGVKGENCCPEPTNLRIIHWLIDSSRVICFQRYSSPQKIIRIIVWYCRLIVWRRIIPAINLSVHFLSFFLFLFFPFF